MNIHYTFYIIVIIIDLPIIYKRFEQMYELLGVDRRG